MQAQNVTAMPTFQFFNKGKQEENLAVIGANYAKVQAGVEALASA